MKETRIQRILKRGELALRRTFISLLSKRSTQATTIRPLHLPLKPKILLLRQDRLGDAIISTPLLVALQEKYPDAKMMMLLGENNKGIAPLLPINCEIFIYKKKILSDIRLLRSLRKKHIDVLIDLQDNASATSSILTAGIGARYSIGIDKENASSYNVLVPRINQSEYHITRRIAELLTPFGIDPDILPLRPVLKDIPFNKVEGRVGIVFSAGAIDRYIPISKNVEIAKAIIETDGTKEIVFFSHPKDELYLQEIISIVNDSRIKPAATTNSFIDYASLLRSCSIVITPDTSAVHLCSAYGIPVLMIARTFPPSLHYWTPIGVEYRMISKDNLSEVDVNEVVLCYKELYSSSVAETLQPMEVAQ
jgi:ADP-heptose:LPS heptosyltransferase